MNKKKSLIDKLIKLKHKLNKQQQKFYIENYKKKINKIN